MSPALFGDIVWFCDFIYLWYNINRVRTKIRTKKPIFYKYSIKALIKKLKSKIFRKGSRVLDVLVLAFFVLAGIVSPGVVKAQSTSEPQEYNASQIAVDSEILINGKADNFVRVGQDGSFEVKMKITLVRPDQLVLGRDKIIFPSATTRNKTVIDFGMTGAGFEGVQAGDACKDESHTGLGFVGSVTYR